MKFSPWLTLAALLALAFSLATSLDPRADGWSKRAKSNNFFGVVFGDGRKLFANQFFTMADVYFHNGYYPSIFDKNAAEQKEIISASHGTKESEEDEKKENFLGQPKDWVDAFGRNFRLTEHVHLENGSEREILPWLRLAADLDPQKIETYTVGSYFLREHLHRTNEAEAFLREGVRHNPENSEILFELGRLYREGGDLTRARNLWELGARKYLALAEADRKDTEIVFDKIAVNLARLEDESGNFGQAIRWFRAAQSVSPNPQALQGQIDAVQKKLDGLAPVPAPK